MKYLLSFLLLFPILSSLSASEWGESPGRGCAHLLKRERHCEVVVRNEEVAGETVVLPSTVKQVLPNDIVIGTSRNYKTEVEDYDGPILVEFSARWCSPCIDTAPFVAEIASEYKQRLKVVSVDVDDSPELARRAGVRQMPLLEFMKKGVATVSLTGRQSRDELKHWVGERVSGTEKFIQPIFSAADPLPKIADIFHRPRVDHQEITPRAEILHDPVVIEKPKAIGDGPTAEQLEMMKEFHLSQPPTILNADGTVRAGQPRKGVSMVISLPAVKAAVSTPGDRAALSSLIVEKAMACVECLADLNTFEQESVLEVARSILACDARRIETLNANGMQDQLSQMVYGGGPNIKKGVSPDWVKAMMEEEKDDHATGKDS